MPTVSLKYIFKLILFLGVGIIFSPKILFFDIFIYFSSVIEDIERIDAFFVDATRWIFFGLVFVIPPALAKIMQKFKLNPITTSIAYGIALLVSFLIKNPFFWAGAGFEPEAFVLSTFMFIIPFSLFLLASFLFLRSDPYNKINQYL